jgi:predicted Zn-dependent protease
LLKEHPNDPYFNELKGQMLYENGHIAEAVPAYRRAVQLLPGAGILKVEFAAALLETHNATNDQEAVRNLEIARQSESDSLELWRLMSIGYARLNNRGMTSLARAEMAVLRGQRAEAQALADGAIRELKPGTPAWQRAQDIKAYIDSRPSRR